MGGVSIWHWLVVGVIVLLLFGRGKISEMMGDVAKGIKAFKKGMTEDETAATAPAASGSEPVKTIEHQPAPVSAHPAGAPAQPASAAPAAPGAPMGERKVG
jgi:sec-independent protein translocase protein TatA